MAVELIEGRMPSCDGKNTLYTMRWQDPELPVKAVVQISHGMCEYVGRYAEMAEYLASNGIAVFGNDHLGHGNTAACPEDLGYIAPKDGYKLMVQDLRNMTEEIERLYPEKKILLYGHSMGSFLARIYAATYSDGISAYVFSGTGGPNPAAPAGKLIIDTLSLIKGERYRSPFMGKMSFGSYCDRIPDAKYGKEWVTSDPEKLESYVNDPFCSFDFTLSAYRDLMNMIVEISDRKWAGKLNSTLPYLLVSGEDDPVGGYGEGVKTVYDRMRAAGCSEAEMRLYPGTRHEPHNEINRKEFFVEILAWMEKALSI